MEQFLGEMRGMFLSHRGQALLRRKFERRAWWRSKTFLEYVHEKVIIGNGMPVAEDEVLDYLIEGLPDVVLRDQACMGRFTTAASLMQASERVSLR